MPLFLSFEDRDCLVVGGGKVAERKIKNILKTTAKITVVSPILTPFLDRLFQKGKIKWERRTFLEEDIEGKFVVFVATDNIALNEKISGLCKNKGVLVNVANPGKSGNFIVPSCAKKGNLVFAFTTGGKAPFFSALVKKDMEKRLKLYYKLFKILEPYRPHLLTKKNVKIYNEKIYSTFFNDDVFKCLEVDKDELVKDLVKKFFSLRDKDKK